jgi:hypothetical protein
LSSAPSGGVEKAMLHGVNSCLIGVSYRKQDEEKYSQFAAFYWLLLEIRIKPCFAMFAARLFRMNN